MLHLLLLPLLAAAHAGGWINDHVLSPFTIGTTAKDVVEEEIGCYGVLAYLIYKVSRLIIEAAPLLEPAWLVGRLLRWAALALALLLSAWLIICVYIGTLIPILSLDVSYYGLVLAPAVSWIALAYTLLAERVRRQRAEIEAQSEGED